MRLNTTQASNPDRIDAVEFAQLVSTAKRLAHHQRRQAINDAIDAVALWILHKLDAVLISAELTVHHSIDRLAKPDEEISCARPLATHAT